MALFFKAFLMINFNGTLQANNTALFDAGNRALQYGDALIEEIRVINGIFMFWEAHYFRLMSSMRILRMEIPMDFTMEFLEQSIRETLQKSELENAPATAELVIIRRNKDFNDADNRVDYLIKAKRGQHPFYVLNDSGLKVELFKDFYVNADMLSNLNTNNKIINVVAKIFANENGYDSCLLINNKKQVVQAIEGNLFMIANGVIKTPPLSDGCLDGIARKQLIELAEQLEAYQLEEASVSPFELQKADELFITNDIEGIISIGNYRKKVYDDKVAKLLIGQLNARARLA